MRWAISEMKEGTAVIVQWLRPLVAGLLTWRIGFDPRPVHLIFVVLEVVLGQVSLPALLFPLSVPLIIPPMPTLLFTYMSLLQAGQMGGALRTYRKLMFFRNLDSTD